MSKVFWFSKHEMTPDQEKDLRDKMGDIEIKQCDQTIKSAFEVKDQMKDCDVVAIVAPIQLQQQFLKAAEGKPVIMAVNDRILVPQPDGTESKVAFAFKKWEQLDKINVLKHDFEWNSPERDGKVFWFSRHEMSEDQIKDLRDKMGNVEIKQCNQTIKSAFDVKDQMKDCDVVAIVAPIQMQQQFLKAAEGKPIIMAASERVMVPQPDGKESKAEFVFSKWEQLDKIEVEKHDFSWERKKSDIGTGSKTETIFLSELKDKKDIKSLDRVLEGKENVKIEIGNPPSEMMNWYYDDLCSVIKNNLGKIEEMHIPNGGSIFTSEDGKYFMHQNSKFDNTDLDLDFAFKGIEHAKIPDGVNNVKGFEGSDISSVEFPDSVKRTWHSAFRNCKNLTEVKFPEGMENIGSFSFKGCDNLKNVYLPDGIKEIKPYAFCACSKLEEIKLPKDLKIIDDATFEECTSLKKVDIGENVSYIGKEAFKECTSLEKIELPENLHEIGLRSFEGCSSLSNVSMKENINYIDRCAFYRCDNFSDIEMPEGFEAMKDSIVDHCLKDEKIGSWDLYYFKKRMEYFEER